MLILEYAVIAICVMFLSLKAADYVDWLDKKTSLSGAFIGGILLSAVTSLPELFTSISSTLLINEPNLCIGNILGSDLFNIMILAVLLLFAINSVSKAKIAYSHYIVMLTVTASYAAIFLNMLGILSFEFITISITSVIIALCYIVSFKYLAAEDGAADENTDNIPLSLKQIIIRFIIVSFGIIFLSIILTYVTDNIADTFNLGKSVAGALFMGIATSLPEVVSTVSLFKKKNYNIAIGNIIGSNIFNLAILALTDFIYVGGGLYDFSAKKTVYLLVCGLISTPLMFAALKSKPKWLKAILLIGVVLCYAAFLLL